MSGIFTMQDEWCKFSNKMRRRKPDMNLIAVSHSDVSIGNHEDEQIANTQMKHSSTETHFPSGLNLASCTGALKLI
jgi:hypothetical protein